MSDLQSGTVNLFQAASYEYFVLQAAHKDIDLVFNRIAPVLISSKLGKFKKRELPRFTLSAPNERITFRVQKPAISKFNIVNQKSGTHFLTL